MSLASPRLRSHASTLVTKASPARTLPCRSTPFAPFSVFLRVLRGLNFSGIRFPFSEIVLTCDKLFMSTREEIDEELASDAPDERFNGAELSESVLGRDWNSPEEDAAWSNL